MLLTNDPPSDKVLEGLYISKLQDSSQVQKIMAPTNQEFLREGGKRDHHRLRMCAKLHIEQAQRSKNFRIQSDIAERAAVTEGKGQNTFTKRKTEECFQWKANGSRSKGDSCCFLHSHASGNREYTRSVVQNKNQFRHESISEISTNSEKMHLSIWTRFMVSSMQAAIAYGSELRKEIGNVQEF